MNQGLSRILKQEFEALLTTELPSFASLKTTLHESAVVYASSQWKGIVAYVILCRGTKDDRFLVEIAWNEAGGAFPGAARQYGILGDPVDGGLRLPLGVVAGDMRLAWDLKTAAAPFKKGVRDSPKAQAIVRMAALDAVQKVLEHAVPYFDGVATKAK